MRVHLHLLLLVALLPTGAMAFDLGGLDLNKLTNIVSKGKDAVTTIGEPQEIEMGSGIASTLLGAAPLVRDAALQKYVNKVGLWLALHTERPDLPWHFGVIDADTINAFAAPGGYVFVTKGLFMTFRDEAELAGVLAHEISHVLRRHHLQAIQKGAQMGLMGDIAGMVIQQKTGKDLDAFISTGMQLYSRGLDKEDEFEADRMGVVIAARSGYDPNGLKGVLLTLENMNPTDDALSLMFKTHPPPKDRLARLDSLMAGHFDGLEHQPQVAKRLLSMQQSLLHARR